MKINIIERESLKRFPINLLPECINKGKFYKRVTSEDIVRYYFLDTDSSGVIEIYSIGENCGLQYRFLSWFYGFNDDVTVDEIDAEIEITIKEL